MGFLTIALTVWLLLSCDDVISRVALLVFSAGALGRVPLFTQLFCL
jgi:hypothetical protein